VGACCINGSDEKCIGLQHCGRKTWREFPSCNGTTVLKLNWRNRIWGCMWFICLRIRASGWVLVITVMELQVPLVAGNFFISWVTIGFPRSHPWTGRPLAVQLTSGGCLAGMKYQFISVYVVICILYSWVCPDRHTDGEIKTVSVNVPTNRLVLVLTF
jgi:hypothetical protein